MKISCAALLEKSYFNYLLGCKQRAAACASRFWAPGLTEGVAVSTFAGTKCFKRFRHGEVSPLQ